MRRAIFFDRDGVINSLVPRPDGRCTSPWSLDEFVLLPRVEEAIALVAPQYDCFIVTNQPHVGHEMTEQELIQIHTHLQHRITAIIEIAWCAVHGSSHYKPNHGMVTDLLHRHQLSKGPQQHYMIGDRWKDIVCGHYAQLTTIFVGDKYIDGGSRIYPDHHVADIYTACQLIMEMHHAR